MRLLMLFVLSVLAASLPAQYSHPEWYGTLHESVWVCNPNTVSRDAASPYQSRVECEIAIAPETQYYNPYIWDTALLVSPDANVWFRQTGLPSAVWGGVEIYFGANLPPNPRYPLVPAITTLKIYTLDVVYTDTGPNPDVVASCRLHVIADPAYTPQLSVYGSSGKLLLGNAVGGDPTYWVGRYPGGALYTPPPPSSGSGGNKAGGDEGGSCSTGEVAVGLWALAPAGLLLLRRKKKA